MHVRHLIFFVLVVIVGGYALFQFRGVLFRPRLDIIEPTNGALLHTTDVRIRGRTDASTIVWIGGRHVQSDEKGYFEDVIPAYPDYNEIGIVVKNHFNKETKTALKFFVQ